MDNRPAVLVITPDFPPGKGGIQSLTYRITAALRSLRPTVVATDVPDSRAFDADQDFPVVRARRLASSRWLSRIELNIVGALLARRQRPDVVLSAHIVISPAAALISRAFGIPFVQYVYANELAARPRLARFAMTRAASTIAISRYGRELAVRTGAAPEKVVIVHPGVDVAGEVRPWKERRSRPTIVTIARLRHRYKGHDVMLRALPLVAARVPDVEWRIIGDGPLRPELERTVRTLKLDDVVSFLGAVSDGERDAELDTAHVFCMVSRLPEDGLAGEGFGIVYLEANARGVPVIAGSTAGAVDAVLDGHTGLLVDPRDHAAVADAIIRLLSSPSLAERMGACGRDWAMRMSWTKAAGEVEAELRRAIA